ncbi:MAG: aminomethyl-transferring glycine dehydrogenase subunit GcvPA [Candidatus Omnitrophica bacterium]|nr:aminomethyl-transferring glycine dehydrogenase subunit GcvPA [Candidatus Omnitrophota bacterium]
MDYAPQTEEQSAEMLRFAGFRSFEEILTAVPASVRQQSFEVPSGLSEMELLALCRSIAQRNRSLSESVSFLGNGAYYHVIPTVVDAISSRGEWLSPYTPYQAEASQGTLQAIYEFQTMICALFQMDVANASLYDGASSLAEAVLLASRTLQRGRVLISEAVHPHAREVVTTYTSGAGTILQTIPTVNGVTDLEALSKSLREDVSCVVLQQPNVFGCLEPMSQAAELAHRVGALFVASVYPISLGVLKPPGAYGADIAVGEGRCLGSPIAYGGPGLGLFTTTTQLLRRIPGRLAGCSVDGQGKRAFTLTLQTREQHIRREKATSNICTNEGWLALRATLFLSLLGPEGLRELAMRNLEKAHDAKNKLCEISGIQSEFDQPFFNEFTLRFSHASMDLESLNKKLSRAGYTAGWPLQKNFPSMSRSSVWCVTEMIQRSDVDGLVETFKKLLS